MGSRYLISLTRLRILGVDFDSLVSMQEDMGMRIDESRTHDLPAQIYIGRGDGRCEGFGTVDDSGDQAGLGIHLQGDIGDKGFLFRVEEGVGVDREAGHLGC